MCQVGRLLNDGINRTLGIEEDDVNQAKILKEFQKLQAKAGRWLKELEAFGKD